MLRCDLLVTLIWSARAVTSRASPTQSIGPRHPEADTPLIYFIYGFVVDRTGGGSRLVVHDTEGKLRYLVFLLLASRPGPNLTVDAVHQLGIMFHY